MHLGSPLPVDNSVASQQLPDNDATSMEIDEPAIEVPVPIIPLDTGKFLVSDYVYLTKKNILTIAANIDNSRIVLPRELHPSIAQDGGWQAMTQLVALLGDRATRHTGHQDDIKLVFDGLAEDIIPEERGLPIPTASSTDIPSTQQTPRFPPVPSEDGNPGDHLGSTTGSASAHPHAQALPEEPVSTVTESNIQVASNVLPMPVAPSSTPTMSSEPAPAAPLARGTPPAPPASTHAAPTSTEHPMTQEHVEIFEHHCQEEIHALEALNSRDAVNSTKPFYIIRLMIKVIEQAKARFLAPRQTSTLLANSITGQVITVQPEHFYEWAARYGFTHSYGTVNNMASLWRSKAKTTLEQLQRRQEDLQRAGQTNQQLTENIQLLQWMIDGEYIPPTPAPGTLERKALQLSQARWKRLALEGVLQ